MKNILISILKAFKYSGKILLCFISILLTLVIFGSFLLSGSAEGSAATGTAGSYTVIDRYDMYITNTFSDALDGVMSIKKVYWLSDEDVVAPEPNQDCFGEVSDPKEMQAIIDQAKDLLEGQELLFSTDVEILKNSTVKYYLDDTLLVITWQFVMDDSVYSLSEVKIADPSQFRRFLSDGKYGSGSKYLTSEMAASVNAVVAANGDYYAMRQMGTIIYNSQMMRAEGYRMDGCFIDRNGDMQFVEVGEITKEEDLEQYMIDNGVRFSLAFGPILVEDGKAVKIKNPYRVGEVDIPNARAAICQVDSLHYLIALTSPQPPYESGLKLDKFAQRLEELGVDKAYNLDGGRSGTLVMNDELINYVYERKVSDIIYFATAMSNGE